MPAPTRRILIGVHVATASQSLIDSLVALHETTAQAFDLVLLVDPAPGEAEALTTMLAALSGVAQLAVPAPGGAPASFNRLVAQPADIYVFLENGVRPGPDWLSHLLRALDADPENGLAGPSTNRCWNEQCVAPNCRATAQDVERQADSLMQRFGAGWRSMAPLHSLSDFCLVVRRDVVAAVGTADPGYGRGPCWEMDYSIRAARAGFRGVWAQAAFVHRAPLPAWRVAAEQALLEANKHLYQDRFCGRRAEPGGREAPYHAQCRGEACADFAPIASIRIHLPLLSADPIEPPPEVPLVSCVMPTRGRPSFVAQSIAYFRRQDYPHRELIIVHEDEADLPGVIDDPSIRVVRTAQRSIGAKRSEGTRAARGAIIAHWDDDDWYGDERLSRQVAPIRRGVADITGLNDILFMALQSGEFWAVTRELFRRLFMENVSGGTLVFRREVWERSGPYPATSLREDADFMAKAMSQGARLCRLPGRDLCIYVRHQRNTWKFQEGRYLQQNGWSCVPEPGILASDRSYYFPARPPAEPPARPPEAPRMRRPERPLVSCIMPTANRRAFVPQAIRQFIAQDYPERELIVIDDGQDSIADLIPQVDSVRYVRLDRRTALGEKRNLACEIARGELVAHWDDDDWMAPQWLESQVQTLLGQGADICGLDKVFFYAPDTRQAWRYVYDGAQPWVCGGTLCYTRELWQRARFPPTNVGEDNAFVWSAQPKRLVVNRQNHLYVAMVHRHNTSPKMTTSRRWRSLSAWQVERLMLQIAQPSS
jgi:glycosyltransferase involved in cell wall biosynthesis